ncbi:hypothetical protein J437_LFUL009976 [Ladona fulva]|uniref:GAE domain-containing protein n=1 Tax=Ladona fulva TaxID=123851 RepID=A0A8K0KDR1_LADFU|nr:hypothetical protein J437_LFUL009976 [Ladona fulva]
MAMVLFSSRIREIVSSFGSHLNVDLQQRGVEFSQLFSKYDHLRHPLLERMPPPPMPTSAPPPPAEVVPEGEENEDLSPRIKEEPDSNALLVLLGGGDESSHTTDRSLAQKRSPGRSAGTADLLDLLGGLDTNDSTASSDIPTLVINNNNLNNLMGQVNTSTDGNFFSGSGAGSPSVVALDKDGLRICISLASGSTPGSTTLNLLMTATNLTASPMTQFLFQAAVPKGLSLLQVVNSALVGLGEEPLCGLRQYLDSKKVNDGETFQLQMHTPSGTAIPPYGQVTQLLIVNNPNKGPLRMRIRASYVPAGGGEAVLEQADVNSFPSC